ncbi:MAG TPA: M17 family peptidase N-terminal domain-containing protein [Solirubrobacterales bacterium]|nr:M17 family peptidase N-terminal domain-containing protein [Solirubrobacterales bacterium]
MKVDVREISHSEAEAELVAIGLYQGDSLPAEVAEAAGAAAASGEFKKLSPAFDGERRLLIVGLGKREEADAERLRVAAALVAKQALQLKAGSLAWVLPESDDETVAAEAIVTGTILAAYRFDRFQKPPEEAPARLQSLTLLASEALTEAAATARVYAEAANRARDLQSTPANSMKPADLAARAEEIAAGFEALSVEVLGPAELTAKKMGGLLAVSQGGPVEPRMIVLRYSGGGSGPTLGLVGKGVTFDTGGISLKPGAGMHEMKYDMSGAAAVLESVAAIAELGLAVDLVAVVPATENMPSGTAIKPGDVITQYNGTTVEVNNTDAEGRLILADALAYAIEQGAERIIDLATLTGAVLFALGHTYAGL